MRVILFLMVLCCSASAFAEDSNEEFRFGVLGALAQYRIDDPAGPTTNGGGAAFGAIAFQNIGRNGRLVASVTRDSYSLAASTTNIGQDVTTLGGVLSYQKSLRLARDIKPWLGVGVGYASSTYRVRHKLTNSGLYSLPLADRTATEIFWALNSNIEWQLNTDWDMGLQAQFTKAVSSNNSSVRVAIYFIY